MFARTRLRLNGKTGEGIRSLTQILNIVLEETRSSTAAVAKFIPVVAVVRSLSAIATMQLQLRPPQVRYHRYQLPGPSSSRLSSSRRRSILFDHFARRDDGDQTLLSLYIGVTQRIITLPF